MDEYSLRTESLSVGYGGRAVVGDLSLSVRPGEVLTLVGPNGAGKSTVLKTLIRQLEPVRGTVFVRGAPSDTMSDNELARALSIVTTGRPGGEWLTVEDVVRSGRYPYTGRLGILSARDREVVEEAMRRLRVSGLREERFRRLSDGQRQRVLLSRALCQEPEILVMDEPTSFLDLRYQLELGELLRDLVSRERLAVILSTHELEFARRVSDTVACIRGGTADRTGPPEILSPEYVEVLYDIPAGTLSGADSQRKGGADSHSFTQNRACEYFPCHKGVAAHDFNCLFCYCPLYALGADCGGNFSYTAKGVKDCSACAFPHRRENYKAVLARFPELAKLAAGGKERGV
ncbi:MAG: ATP-binding cassette domain-containing protein [Oscillibacter sp.]|nr:ATP-binding cassette domain-containing protein [Oscillibacter sp.]